MIMSRSLRTILLCFPLLASCVQMYEEDTAQNEPQTPVLSLSCSLVGSYSAQFVCDIECDDRIFIKGEFEYSRDPDFNHSERVTGILSDKRFFIVVTDIQRDSRYYVRAFASDTRETYESAVADFESAVFNTSNLHFHSPWKDSEFTFEIETLEDFTVDLRNCDWIELSSTKADTFRKTVRVRENPDLQDRSAFAIVASPDGFFRDTLIVEQDGRPISVDDPGLKKYLVSTYDSNGSGEIELAELGGIVSIDIPDGSVSSLDAVRYLPELRRISCPADGNGKIHRVDLSGNPRLAYLDLSGNRVDNIDISCCPNLKTLLCRNCRLDSLVLSGNEPLEELDCSGNSIRTLNLFHNTSLVSLICDGNNMASIEDIRSEALQFFSCQDNNLETLDIRRNRNLHFLDCSNNRLEELSISNNEALTTLNCENNPLTFLHTDRNPGLVFLACSFTSLDALKLGKNPKLSYLDCFRTRISELDLNANTALVHLNCSDNPISTLDVSILPDLAELYCNCNDMTILYVDASQSIEGVTTGRDEQHVNGSTSIRIHNMLAAIEDEVFKSLLLEYYDLDNDGEMTLEEASSIVSVNINTDNVRTLKGIENLSNLKYLCCKGSINGKGESLGLLESLDLSGNPMLEQLICTGNRIKTVNLSKNYRLRTLWCNNNLIETLDTQVNTKLEDLNCERNLIRSLDLSSCKVLSSLDCSPMNDKKGNNLLERIVLPGCNIRYVTYDRSPSNIPDGTVIYYSIPDSAASTALKYL